MSSEELSGMTTSALLAVVTDQDAPWPRRQAAQRELNLRHRESSRRQRRILGARDWLGTTRGPDVTRTP